MTKGLVFLALALLLTTSAAAQDKAGALAYDCSGISTFRGEVPLVRDPQSQVPGVERTYFGSTTVQDPGHNLMTGLIMIVAGKNRGDGDLNRLCFGWIFGRTPDMPNDSISGSFSGGERCAGLLSKNGEPWILIGNGRIGAIQCTLRVTLPNREPKSDLFPEK
jgi:hypothetical protein